ncbi:MAG: Hsp20/alpha crystallin family protein [Bacteroidota bacterium]
MLERAERLRRQFFRLPSEHGQGFPAWEPPVDVFESETALVILVALPGVEPGDVGVVIEGETVIVTGSRPLQAMANSFLIHRLEIPHGRFERRLRLASAGRLELIQRELARGCLLLSFRKLD